VSNNVQEPLPIEVSHFGNFEARMLRNFQSAVEDWDEVCAALGAWEAQHLTSDDSGQAVQHHHRWVTELLSWGRLVQQATRQPEFPDKTLANRVDARIRHLEDKLSLWHGDMPPAEQDRILQAAFK
jgi:DNA-binding transcriptional regulator YbjK